MSASDDEDDGQFANTFRNSLPKPLRTQMSLDLWRTKGEIIVILERVRYQHYPKTLRQKKFCVRPEMTVHQFLDILNDSLKLECSHRLMVCLGEGDRSLLRYNTMGQLYAEERSDDDITYATYHIVPMF